MVFNAKVSIAISKYCGEDSYEEEYFNIVAKNEEEASDKVYDYFSSKSCPYDTVYNVLDIVFFTHLD